jgi:hypothetical protein
MRSETVSYNQKLRADHGIYQMDAGKTGGADLDVLVKIDRILDRLDQIDPED